MPAFQNRERELEQICADTDRVVLLNVYGEAGIGKSRLLDEAAQRMRAKSPPALVLQVDIKSLVASASAGRPDGVLRSLISQEASLSSDDLRDTEQVAGQVVAQLSALAGHRSVVLMFDTTEVLQEDMGFWRWMEEHLVGPLAVEGQVRQVFAGRVPVPWRRIEARRALELLPLSPLSPQDAARDLIREVLQTQNPDLEDDKTEDAIGLVLEFSFGHPSLSEELAAGVASRWTASPPAAFKHELCERVVKPFVEQYLFEDIEPPWKEILWWASVLDWFDATVLQRYMGRVAPVLVEGQPDYFFIQGITRLRIHNTVVWREEHGDRLHGVIGDIVRHCLRVMDPERYRGACTAAAKTFEALANEFPDGDPDAEQYCLEAEMYRQRAEQEAKQ